jgi:hypothetical protein
MRFLTLVSLSIFALLSAAAIAAGEPGSGAASKKTYKYGGVKKCKSCHEEDPIGNQYAWWLEDKHSKAFETLASDKAKKWATEAGVGDPQTADECVKCHVTAHGVEKVGVKFDRTQGVQCEACHGAGTGYRKKKIMMDRDRAVERGLVLQTEEVCTSCHNDESPAWDPERYTLADGSKKGFDFDQAVKLIAHPVPEGYDPMAEGEAD